MKVTVLTENTAESPLFTAEHGLAVNIETEKNNILADTGQTAVLIRNAAAAGIDPGKINKVILSHGHYDHTGGLMPFLEVNGNADIYINKNAFGSFYNAESGYIGVDERIKNLPGIHLLSGTVKIDEEITVFDFVTGRELYPFGNRRLLEEKDGVLREDSFSHEQYTVIMENGKNLLVSGCAHRGIVNIVEAFISLYGREPDYVLSGFHLMKKTPYTAEELSLIRETALRLKKYNTVFYTGHCTGDALPLLKEIMGEKLVPIHTGMQFTL